MRKPKDHRNGQFSGVECSSLNPAPSFLLSWRTLSSSPPPRRRIEGCGKKVGGKIFIQLCFFYHLHFDTSFGLLSVRGKSEFNLCIRTYFSKSPNMANIDASLGAQIPRSVINPVTKRAGVTSKPWFTACVVSGQINTGSMAPAALFPIT